VPRARNRVDRCAQALRWLARNWPLGRPIELVWRDVLTDYDTGKKNPELDGQTYREGTRIVIELKRQRCRKCLLATLWHEYGHAYLWGVAGGEFDREHHPTHFYTLLGEIEELWNEIGHEEANEYEVD